MKMRTVPTAELTLISKRNALFWIFLIMHLFLPAALCGSPFTPLLECVWTECPQSTIIREPDESVFLFPELVWCSFTSQMRQIIHSKVVTQIRLGASKLAKLILDTSVKNSHLGGFNSTRSWTGFQKLATHIPWLKNAHSLRKHLIFDVKFRRTVGEHPRISLAGNQREQKSALRFPETTSKLKRQQAQEQEQQQNYYKLFTQKNPSQWN